MAAINHSPVVFNRIQAVGYRSCEPIMLFFTVIAKGSSFSINVYPFVTLGVTALAAQEKADKGEPADDKAKLGKTNGPPIRCTPGFAPGESRCA